MEIENENKNENEYENPKPKTKTDRQSIAETYNSSNFDPTPS
jgi:hypothetical protein